MQNSLKIIGIVLSCFTIFTAMCEPDWVLSMKSGKYSMKVVSGDKILFRDFGKTCEQVRNRIIKSIMESLSLQQQPPVTVELKYKTDEYCALTLSILRKDLRNYNYLGSNLHKLVGMSYNKVFKLLKVKKRLPSFNKMCYNVYKSGASVMIMNYVICFDNFKTPIVVGILRD